jgi:hypothetical protein
MGCDDDQLRRRTERGGCVVTTGGVRLNDEGKGQIVGTKLVLNGGRGGGAGKTAQAAHASPGIGQNASFRSILGVHLENVGLEAYS